jgi:hypothetical protein
MGNNYLANQHQLITRPIQKSPNYSAILRQKVIQTVRRVLCEIILNT